MKAVLLLLAVMLLGSGPARAALTYAGPQTLWQDTVWEGEVLIDGVLTVAPEVVLEIRPGTVVRFTHYDSNDDGIGEHEIFIQGRLLAEGTVRAPILFTAAQPDPRPGSWGAIKMMMAEEENIFAIASSSTATAAFMPISQRQGCATASFAAICAASSFRSRRLPSSAAGWRRTPTACSSAIPRFYCAIARFPAATGGALRLRRTDRGGMPHHRQPDQRA